MYLLKKHDNINSMINEIECCDNKDKEVILSYIIGLQYEYLKDNTNSSLYKNEAFRAFNEN